MYTAPWSLLDHEVKRDSLFIVVPGLDLETVALAIAQDKKAEIESWINSEQIKRPSPNEIKDWQTPPEATFNFYILQPFVVAQLVLPTSH